MTTTKTNNNIIRSRENKDFVMYYRKFIDDITKLAGENYTAFRIFQFFCKHMDSSNALVISTQALSDILELSTRTVQRATKYLNENGWVCILKSGNTNAYIVNPELVWTAYADQKSSCKFKSNVILSSSENAEFLNNKNATTHYKTVDVEFLNNLLDKMIDAGEI